MTDFSKNFLPSSLWSNECSFNDLYLKVKVVYIFLTTRRHGLRRFVSLRLQLTWDSTSLAILHSAESQNAWSFRNIRCVFVYVFFLKEAIPFCIIKYILHEYGQYTTHAKTRCLLQLGYSWRHVSAVNRPSSGQLRIILLRYSQNNFDCTLTVIF